MKRLAENQMILKSNIFTADIIIGPRSNTLSNTKQYFYFLVARNYIWSCKAREVLPKIRKISEFSILFSILESSILKNNK